MNLKSRKFLRGILQRMLNWIYPRHCPLCHEILRDQTRLICPDCEKGCHPIREPRCKKCSKEIEENEAEYCSDCRKKKHFYEAGISIYSYDQKMKTSLLKHKYGGRKEYGDFYAEECIRYGGAYLRQWKIEGIVPVPMSRRSKRKRGFNQAEILAEKIGERLGIPVYRNCLKKIKDTEVQKALGAQGRRKNLKGTFQGTEGNWGIQRVLIVDDVYTTGSTIDEAAREILAHGVQKVYFLTIFIGKGF